MTTLTQADLSALERFCDVLDDLIKRTGVSPVCAIPVDVPSGSTVQIHNGESGCEVWTGT